MKKNVYSLLVMVALALTATFTACSDDDDDSPPVEIKLDENIVTVLPGESIAVKVLEGNGGYQVTSQNSAIATASVNESTITVTGVMESEEDQTTTIEVVDAKQKTATIKVYVTKSVNPLKIDLEETTFEMVVGDTKEIEIISGNPSYTVVGSNVAAVEVSEVANNVFTITAKKVSETPVTVTLKDSKSREVVLTVTKVAANEVTSIAIDEAGKDIKLTPGKTFELAGHVSWLPLTADVPTLLYSSSEKPVATVDANGKITAVSVGTTVITVKVEGTDIEETTTVTVTEPVLVLLDNTGWTASCSDFADWTEYDENGNVGWWCNPEYDIFSHYAFNKWWEARNTDGSAAGEWLQVDMKSLKNVKQLVIARRGEGANVKGFLKKIKVQYSDADTASPGLDTFKDLMEVSYSEQENYGSSDGVETEISRPNILDATTSMRHIKIIVLEQWRTDVQPCIGFVDVYGYE
mgnify:FL=1|jgi:hypothetical protein